MRWLKLSLFIVGGLAGLLTLALVALLSADLGIFKTQIEQLVTEASGRQFTINGDLHLSIGSTTTVTANDARLENADWAPEPLMLDLGQFELQLDTWSLIKGPILIELLRISDATANLARSESEGNNWDLGDNGNAEPKPSDDRTPDAATSARDWLLRQVEVDNARVIYTSPSRPAPLDLHVGQLRQQHGADGFLQLMVQAELTERAVEINARFGPWESLLNQKNMAFSLDTQIDTLKVSGEGFIDDLLKPRKPTLAVSASGPALNDLARLLNLPEEYVGDIDLTGALQPDTDGTLKFDLSGNIGQMLAKGIGRVSDLSDFEQVDLELAVSGPDLNRLLRLAGAQVVQAAPYAIEFSADRRGKELTVRKAHMQFADSVFDLTAMLPNFPTVDGANIKLSAAGQNFERLREVTGLPGAATGPYSLTASLSDALDGAERVQLEARSSLLRLSAIGRLGNAPDYVGSQLKLQLDADSLSAVGEAYALEAMPDRPLSVQAAIELQDAGIRTTSPMRLTSDDLSATVEGLIAPGSTLVGTDLVLSVSAPDFAEIAGDFVASDLLPALPVTLDGKLKIESGGYRLRNLDLRLGSTSIALNGLVQPKGGFAGSSLHIVSAGPKLEELLASTTMAVYPGPFDLSTGLAVSKNRINLTDMKFLRQRGQISGEAQITLPLSAQQGTFSLQGSGDSLHALLGAPLGFQPAASPFRLNARGQVRGQRLAVDKLEAVLGRSKVSASGQLALGNGSDSAQLLLAIDIPDLAELGTFKGRRFNSQRFTLDAQADSKDSTVRIEDLSAILGNSDIRGSVVFVSSERPHLDVSVESERLHFTPLLEAEAVKAPVASRVTDGRLIPDVPLPLDLMRHIDGTAAMTIKELQRDALRLTDVGLSAALRDGALDVLHLGLKTPRGWLQGKASLHPAGESANATLALSAEELSVVLLGLNSDSAASAKLDINLESTGADLRTLMGNLNGISFLRIDDLAFTENRFVRRLYGDLLNEIVSVINPLKRPNKEQRLECMVVPLEFNDGMARTIPALLVRNEAVHIATVAGINLKNEKIDLQFKTTPRKGFTISAGEVLNPYVRVTGSLAKPRLVVDAGGALISGGAAVTTGGLSILAKAAWGRLSRDQDPCGTAESLALKAFSGRLAALEPAKTLKPEKTLDPKKTLEPETALRPETVE